MKINSWIFSNSFLPLLSKIPHHQNPSNFFKDKKRGPCIVVKIRKKNCVSFENLSVGRSSEFKMGVQFSICCSSRKKFKPSPIQSLIECWKYRSNVLAMTNEDCKFEKKCVDHCNKVILNWKNKKCIIREVVLPQYI